MNLEGRENLRGVLMTAGLAGRRRRGRAKSSASMEEAVRKGLSGAEPKATCERETRAPALQVQPWKEWQGQREQVQGKEQIKTRKDVRRERQRQWRCSGCGVHGPSPIIVPLVLAWGGALGGGGMIE